MNITRFGHACLQVEESGVSIIVDPGNWNEAPVVDTLDAILITHEHGDHMDLGQIQMLLTVHPEAVIISHAAVGALLTEAGIPYIGIEEGGTTDVKGVSIESFGHDHAIIYGDTSPCRNTGFLIAERLFIPGDALHDVPTRPVEILALPTGGPWMKIGEAVEYAKKIAPKVVFPIHDAMHTEEYSRTFIPSLFNRHLGPTGIEFRDMAVGSVGEF